MKPYLLMSPLQNETAIFTDRRYRMFLGNRDSYVLLGYSWPFPIDSGSLPSSSHLPEAYVAFNTLPIFVDGVIKHALESIIDPTQPTAELSFNIVHVRLTTRERMKDEFFYVTVDTRGDVSYDLGYYNLHKFELNPILGKKRRRIFFQPGRFLSTSKQSLLPQNIPTPWDMLKKYVSLHL